MSELNKNEEKIETTNTYLSVEDEIVFSEKERKRKRVHNPLDSSAYEDMDGYIFKTQSRGKKNSKHHKKKRRKKRIKIAIAIISILLALIILLLCVIGFLYFSGRNEMKDNKKLAIDVPSFADSSENGRYITYKGVKYKYNNNVATILCMGIDKDKLDKVHGKVGTGGDADSLFLITLDTENGTTNLVNISRETMAQVALYSAEGKYIETTKTQICLAYAYGNGRETSCLNELTAVKRLYYNVRIASDLALDLDGISKINDAMGGVQVTSPETIGIFKAGETYTLKGSQAQSFVRLRSHATVQGNNLRMDRQKTYIESFSKKLIDQTKSNITTPLNLFNTASPYICTNINASKITYMAITALRGGYKEFQVKTVPGKVKKGETYAEFYVNEKKFFELFLSLYYTPVSK